MPSRKKEPKPRKGGRLTPEAIPPLERKYVQRFLEAMAKGIPNAPAAKMAGVSQTTLYKLRNAHPEFEEAWLQAYKDGTDTLENEARRRGVEGVLKPVWYQGERVGTVREFSDVLLMFTLKARDRARYSDVPVKIVTPDGDLTADPHQLAGRPLVGIYLGVSPTTFEVPPKP